MKRAINFRSFLYSAIMLIFSIIFCLVALNVPWLGFILLISIVFVPIIIGIIYKKKLRTFVLVTLLLTSLLCFISVIFFFAKVFNWQSGVLPNRTYHVEGVIDDSYNIDEERRVILKSVRIGDSNTHGRLMLTISEDIDFEAAVGDSLDFYAYVYSRELISGYRINGTYLRSNIRYTATVKASNIDVSPGESNLLGSINLYINRTLKNCMGDKYGAIAYGILTGDKNEISSSVRDSFSTAGIAHILAVSGLHIGVLIGIATFILRKLKVKRLPTFITNAIIVLLYSAFAGFSPSVLRACLMFLVGSGAMLFGEEKDSLNSLGLAATAIMTFNPLMLFETGFVMSISAVFGLICFVPIITSGLTKIKIPPKVADIIAVPTAAQIGILPATVYFFGTINLYSIIVNIILMPLMSVAFIAVFVGLVLSFILPVVLTVSGYLIRGLTVGADLFSGLPYALLEIKSSLIIFSFYPIYLMISSFVNFKHKRTVVLSCCGVMFMILFVLIMI